mmetsp:Transcript_22097/g.35699  ORF Transcript_22097/g.35699 Transcript_22097/m.35699 type:complete len:443 (-) Transcript_22097:104-1432(-)
MAETTAATTTTVALTDARKKKKAHLPRRVKHSQQIPLDILNNEALKEAMKILPDNYSFEIPKTIWRLREAKSKRVALQFPEGLLMYSLLISDILEKFAGVDTLVMGDVTYGACCVDDFSARALDCDFVVHYGHSCLVPVDPTGPIKMLYVFVEIGINVKHLVSTVEANFKPGDNIILAGTIQFTAAVRTAKRKLASKYSSISVPQAKPLSPGEVLGCTAPRLIETKAKGQDGSLGATKEEDNAPTVIFVADGRFHLESLMIQNPDVRAFYKYDPYSRKITLEKYDHSRMHQLRQKAIKEASKARVFGVVMGTLGRQGNTNIVNRIKKNIEEAGKEAVIVLLSEVFPAKLRMFKSIEAWVQVACPRLSIDWGHAFQRPLLSPYELEVALDLQKWKSIYPMDFYKRGGGPWSNYHPETKRVIRRKRKTRRKPIKMAYEEKQQKE